MSTPQLPLQAKAVVSLVMKDRHLLGPVAQALCRVLGSLDVVSPWLPFDYTDYYRTEMGTPLSRRVLAFKDLVPQDGLADLKRATNEVEGTFACGGCRRVNIDPGHLLRERFVLASGKNFTHRIYLAKGIYADLTLIYTRGAFRRLEWTYPDYADGPMLAFLTEVRNKYVVDLKGETWL